MASKFRGVKWNNARFPSTIKIRRSIDLAELGDFGSITDDTGDLPTAGAAHRADHGGSTSATRGHTDLRGIAGQHSNVVDTQDMGLISDATTTHRVWSAMGAITDVVTEAPTGILAPEATSSGGTSSVDFGSISLEHTLTTPSIIQYGRYGSSVAVNDTYVAGGAPGMDSTHGKVFVHNLSDGSLKYTIDNPSTNTNYSGGDWFGKVVDMSDSYVLVVAPYEDETSSTVNTGKAYLYDLSDGTLKYILPRGSADRDDYYGAFHNSTALNDDYAVIGARGAGNGGKVLIYDLSDNTLTRTLTGNSGADFGETVALTDSYVIVGAPGEKKTYVYNILDFSLEYTLSNPNSETSSTSDNFGKVVAASGSTLVVGARNEDYGYPASGTVYVYDLTNGTLSRTIHNPDTDDSNVSGNYFGLKLALDGDNLVAGMNSPTNDGGRTFIIDITDGSLVKTIYNPVTNAGNTEFAADVGIKDDYIVIGSSEQSAGSNITQAGKVYVYKA